MDGACTDPTWQNARAYPLEHGATVRFAANRDFLYVCVTPPDAAMRTSTSTFGTRAASTTSTRPRSWVSGPGARLRFSS